MPRPDPDRLIDHPDICTHQCFYAGKPPRDWDFTCFNPEFFRHYEKRMGQLRALGIEADLVLFNPYGKFGLVCLDSGGHADIDWVRIAPTVREEQGKSSAESSAR